MSSDDVTDLVTEHDGELFVARGDVEHAGVDDDATARQDKGLLLFFFEPIVSDGAIDQQKQELQTLTILSLYSTVHCQSLTGTLIRSGDASTMRVPMRRRRATA